MLNFHEELDKLMAEIKDTVLPKTKEEADALVAKLEAAIKHIKDGAAVWGS